mgnify:CR=1 FL=1
MGLVALTALGVGGATIIGALLGFIFKNASQKISKILLAFAGGVMLSAAVFGLILPSLEYGGKFGILITILGIFAGALCLNLIDKFTPHLHKMIGVDIEEHKKTNLNKNKLQTYEKNFSWRDDGNVCLHRICTGA